MNIKEVGKNWNRVGRPVQPSNRVAEQNKGRERGRGVGYLDLSE